jgi:hypothetical protein
MTDYELQMMSFVIQDFYVLIENLMQLSLKKDFDSAQSDCHPEFATANRRVFNTCYSNKLSLTTLIEN